MFWGGDDVTIVSAVKHYAGGLPGDLISPQGSHSRGEIIDSPFVIVVWGAPIGLPLFVLVFWEAPLSPPLVYRVREAPSGLPPLY